MSGRQTFGLAGRRALVAAASSGLGEAVTAALCAEGARVVGSARSAEGQQRIAAYGAMAVIADLAEPEAPSCLVAEAVGLLGGLDLVLCCATAGASGHSEDDWAQSFAVDLAGPRRLADAARPHLAQSAAARVIHISSRSAHIASAQAPAYAAAKAALEQLTRAQAAAWAGEGIRVNCVAPGSFLTGRSYWDRAPQARRDAMQDSMPFGRMAGVADIIPTILFLASDGAAWITGQTVLVDGGQTLAP